MDKYDSISEINTINLLQSLINIWELDFSHSRVAFFLFVFVGRMMQLSFVMQNKERYYTGEKYVFLKLYLIFAHALEAISFYKCIKNAYCMFNIVTWSLKRSDLIE